MLRLSRRRPVAGVAAVAAAALLALAAPAPARAQDAPRRAAIGFNGVLAGDRPRTLLEAVEILWDRPIPTDERSALEARWDAIAERARRVDRAIAELPADGPLRDAFEAARAEVDRRRMSHSGTIRGRNGARRGQRDGAQVAERNFHEADRLIDGWVASGEPLTLEKLAELNRNFGRGLHNNGREPGTLRGAGFNLTSGGNARRTYVLGEHVEGAMRELMRWYDRALAQGMNPIELASQFQMRLVSIHPFPDANGRTTRAATDFILRSAGLPSVALRQGEHLLGVFGHSLVHEGRAPDNKPVGMAERSVTNGLEATLVELERGLGLPEGRQPARQPARRRATGGDVAVAAEVRAIEGELRAAVRGAFPRVHFMASAPVEIVVTAGDAPEVRAEIAARGAKLSISAGMLRELERASRDLPKAAAQQLRRRALALAAIDAVQRATSMPIDAGRAARKAGVFGERGLEAGELGRIRGAYERAGLAFPEEIQRQVAEANRPLEVGRGRGIVGERAPGMIARIRDRVLRRRGPRR